MDKLLEDVITLVDKGTVEQRCAAVLVLGALKINNAAVSKSVGALLESPNPVIKDYALRYFEEVQPKSSISQLLKMLDDADKDVQERAVRSLVASGQAAVAPLLQGMEGASRLWQLNACRVLCQLRGKTAMKGALQLLGGGTDETNRIVCDLMTPALREMDAKEQDAFYDRMTGLEWVTALVRLNGLDEAAAEQAARRALGVVDLLAAADKKIGAYSKGMRQRVKLAQALVHDPELLILDEPLSGMDPLMRRKTIRLVKEWARSGRHIIVSSHILHEIESMTSNILLINNGRIVAEGNVHQIRDLIDTHPHTVYVRGSDPRALARRFLAEDDVLSLKFEPGAVVVETARPDRFYARLTDLAASGEAGAIDEVQSPDDNLQAVFRYLVKQ